MTSGTTALGHTDELDRRLLIVETWRESEGARYQRIEHDVAELRADIRDVRSEIQGVRGEVHDVRGEVAGLRRDMDSKFDKVDGRFDRLLWFVMATFGAVLVNLTTTVLRG